jgi:hypothetical protein
MYRWDDNVVRIMIVLVWNNLNKNTRRRLFATRAPNFLNGRPLAAANGVKMPVFAMRRQQTGRAGLKSGTGTRRFCRIEKTIRPHMHDRGLQKCAYAVLWEAKALRSHLRRNGERLVPDVARIARRRCRKREPIHERRTAFCVSFTPFADILLDDGDVPALLDYYAESRMWIWVSGMPWTKDYGFRRIPTFFVRT